MAASETLSVPATSEGIRLAVDAFEAFAAGRGLPVAERWRFQVAIDELLSNIVRHGRHNRTGRVSLSFTLTETDLAVSISDSCDRFDPTSWPKAISHAELDRQALSGRGIALVRALMDDVHHEWQTAGNDVRISRRLRTSRS